MMIELPEAITIAEQMNSALRGKRVKEAFRGNAPHKFAFYNMAAEDYTRILSGKTISDTWAEGNLIYTRLEPDHFLLLGGGGERIILHHSAMTIPKKHQFMASFDDGTFLTVTIQMWGAIKVLDTPDVASNACQTYSHVSPLSDTFTYDFFDSLFDNISVENSVSIKYFMISEPGIYGLGNGCLQDILFRAGLHPKRQVIKIDRDDKLKLYSAIRSVVQEMTDKGGRDSEIDLFGHPGGYNRILSSASVGKLCHVCETPIERISYLGGTSYFCPRCQEI